MQIFVILHEKVDVVTTVFKVSSMAIDICTNHSAVIGPCSSVGIATDYGLDGPGIESRWGRDIPNPSRPALEPTQPTVQWVPGFPGVNCGPGRAADHSPTSSAEVIKE
jgi:hypothetical protein